MAAKKTHLSNAEVDRLARAAGLDKAVKRFPQDVAIAVQAAESAHSSLRAQENVAAEPWPPMRVRGAP